MTLDERGRTSGEIGAQPSGPIGRHSANVRERFALVVEQHHQTLARMAFLMCGSQQQAEDSVAEAYARVWPKFRRGKVDDVVPYLRRAVVNQVHGGFRRSRLERREAERQRLDWESAASHEGAVAEAETVLPALARLPAEQRAVLVLRYYEDLSEDEIAATLGIAPGTVKSRCARGLEQLRRVLGGAEHA